MAKPQQPNPWRYAHIGLELAGAIVALALVGLWVDYSFGTEPWGVLVGVLVGTSGGLYLFIKDALAANRQFSYDRFARKDDAEQPPGRDEPDASDHSPDDSPPEPPESPESPDRSDKPHDP